MAYTSQYAQDEMAKSVAGPGKGDKKKNKYVRPSSLPEGPKKEAAKAKIPKKRTVPMPKN
jgi:hypothetical protein